MLPILFKNRISLKKDTCIAAPKLNAISWLDTSIYGWCMKRISDDI